MGVQKHLFGIERGVIEELLKLKTNTRSFTKFLLIANTLKRSRAPRWEFPGILSSMFEGVFLECNKRSKDHTPRAPEAF